VHASAESGVEATVLELGAQEFPETIGRGLQALRAGGEDEMVYVHALILSIWRAKDEIGAPAWGVAHTQLAM